MPNQPDAGVGATTSAEVTKLVLVEGAPFTLSDGTVVTAKGIIYTHESGSRNSSLCSLVLTRGSEKAEIGLVREHGDPNAQVSSADALGWRFTLEMADPYQQPSRATVNAQKLAR